MKNKTRAKMKPCIGITMGDPAGIGSEITVKMFAGEDLHSLCIPIVIGSKFAMENIKDILKQGDLEIYCINNVSEARQKEGMINLIDLANLREGDFTYGKVGPLSGRASGEYIAKGIEMALAGELDALVTNPIHKESFKLGGCGVKYPGHTEMLADLTKTKDYTMMLATAALRVVHVSTHVSLKEAVQRVKKARIIKVIKIANDACLSLGIEQPKIAVAGLNPHCGEGGLFGNEELEEIIPAVEEARAAGINVSGPLPADTIFAKALGGVFDMVVTMIHD